MEIGVGIILAFAAMIFWGFGDFLMQKSTRKIGIWETIFIITSMGFIVLTPFVIKSANSLFTAGIEIFLVAGVAFLIASFLDLEALKEGKLDTIEPIWSFEIVSSALLAFFILKEVMTNLQLVFIVVLILSLILVSTKRIGFHKRILFEKGVYIALAAALVMGVANFFIGLGSREIDPITFKWGMDLFLMVGSFVFILKKGRLKDLGKTVMKNKKILTFMSLFDNAAWLVFGFSMVLAPISIAVAISESYIVIAVLLGFFVNKEKLSKHQIVGIVLALISTIYLATTIG